MTAKDFLKEMGIHPTEPIYWDLENKTIQLDELLEIYAEAKAKEFAEWVNGNYTLVTSEELQKSAWVNLKRSVYVNGSDFHYTKMINEFGETIEQLYKNYNQNG